MEKEIPIVIGRKEYAATVECYPRDSSLWEVTKDVVVLTESGEKLYARRGDLIRVNQRSAHEGFRTTYSVFNLATLRRAETKHIREGVGSVCRLIDHWSVRLTYIISRLDDWTKLNASERDLLSNELYCFIGAFWGAKAWQKEVALEKVISSAEIRDRLNRPNPQGIGRRLRSAQVHLLNYRRGMDKAMTKNARLGVLAEQLNADYKRRFAEVRKLVQLGFSADSAVTETRMKELMNRLISFTINPWSRPAREAMNYLALAEGYYLEGDRTLANRVLRMIPILFSAESRLSRTVEVIHRVDKLGASLDPPSGHLAGDILYPAVAVMERLAGDERLWSYQLLARDVAYYLGHAEMNYRCGRVRLARKYLKTAEARIRGKEV